MTLRVGIDVGGTFTDVTAFDEQRGELATVRKYLSNPADPASVLEDRDVAAEDRDVDAIKEVFDRAGGKASSAPGQLEAPRLLNVTWQRPPSKPKARAKPSASTPKDAAS